MAKSKKKSAKLKKPSKTGAKTRAPKLTMDPKTDATNIADGSMKSAFREAFLRREI